MIRQPARLVPALAGTFLLSGCSYVFTIVATFDGGRLLLQAEEQGWALFRPEVCFKALSVSAEDRRARGIPPPSGNWMGGRTPLVWSLQPVRQGTNACIGEFPVRYGEAPPGARVTVPPRRLRPDIVYEVTASAPGIDGFGRFRLRRSIRIENLDP